MNPYQAETKSAEFFSCGFLQHTSIFVAESLVDEVTNGLTNPSCHLVLSLSIANLNLNLLLLYKQTYKIGLIPHQTLLPALIGHPALPQQCMMHLCCLHSILFIIIIVYYYSYYHFLKEFHVSFTFTIIEQHCISTLPAIILHVKLLPALDTKITPNNMCKNCFSCSILTLPREYKIISCLLG